MDLPYVIIFVVLLVLAYFYWKVPQGKYIKLSCISVLLFIGARARVVGGDTIDYVRYFVGEFSIYSYYEHVEQLFRQYNKIMGILLFHNEVLYLLVHTFICLLPIYKLAQKESNSIPLSCLLFFVCGYYIHYMSALRQVLGLSILLWGIIYVIDKRKYRWIVFILSGIVGWSFHSSVFIAFWGYLLCYFFAIKKKKIYYIGIIFTSLIGVVFKSFNVSDFFALLALNHISEMKRMNEYLSWGLVDNDLGIFTLLSSSIVSIFVIYLMDRNRVNSWVLKLYWVGIMLTNLFYAVPMINRLTLPFSIMGIFCMTWMFDSRYKLAQQSQKLKIKVLILLVIGYFSQSYVKQQIYYDLYDNMLLHPYYFFWQDYHKHPSLIQR